MTLHGGPRAAIIGAGLMGRWHADAVRRIGGRVAIIVDPDEVARHALGRRHPGARLVPDFDAALLATTSTAAHICTPVSTHAAMATALVGAGIHALVEKPLTASAESTTTLMAAAQARGVVVCPVHQFLFQGGTRRLLRWLPTLGTVRRVEFSTCSAGALGDDAASLDDLIGEVLPHPLALFRAILGTPLERVNWQTAHPTPGEFRALATAGSAILDVAISAHGRPTENTLRVVADEGSVTVDLFHGYATRHSSTVSRRAKITAPFVKSGKAFGGASANLVLRVARREPAYPGLRELVRAFYAAIGSGGPAPIEPDAVTDVAISRDRLLARLRGSAA
jgi:predicted dehydrogenase